MNFLPTKGIEYALVLGYLALLIPFWRWFSQSSRAPRVRIAAVDRRRATAARANWFQTPEDLFFHRGHTWARPKDSNLLEIGADDFAYGLIGPPDALLLPQPGSRLKQGEKGWSARIDGHLFDFLAPIDGEVVAINEDAEERPALASADPYERGWLMHIRSANPISQLRNLMPAHLAESWMGSVEHALGQRMGLPEGTVLQDGGLPVSGFARQIGGDRWHELAEEFLLTRKEVVS